MNSHICLIYSNKLWTKSVSGPKETNQPQKPAHTASRKIKTKLIDFNNWLL